jgi:hypothetical protein
MSAAVTLVGLGFSSERTGAFAGKPLPKGDFRRDLDGRPQNFKEGEVTGYALWHDAKGWHLRMATTGKAHRFRGHIYVQNGHTKNGTFSEIRSLRGGKEETLAKHWKVHPKRDQLFFDFSTGEAVDGIDFTLSKEAFQLQVDLQLDGKAAFDHIFIGGKGTHPPGMPFVVPAHPQPKKS